MARLRLPSQVSSGRGVAIAAAVVVSLLPVAFMWAASLRRESDIIRSTHPFTLWTLVPRVPTLENYRDVLVQTRFHINIVNSLIVALGQTSLILLVNSLAAYAFARLQFKGKELLFGITLATLLFPLEVSMVPLLLTVQFLGFQDTYGALIVPWIAQPFAIFLMRQYFLGLPRELDEAAMIDGCSYWGIYRHVILPNSKPILITLSLIQFQAAWDSFFWPLIAHGVQMIVDVLRSAKQPITVVPTGPLSNVAAALILEPGIREKIREIVLMGGAIGLGNRTPAAEANIWHDPEAASVVVDSGVPIRFVPLEATHMALFTRSEREKVTRAGGRCLAVAGLMGFTMQRYEQLYQIAGYPLHDPCAVALAACPELATWAHVHVAVEIVSELTRGRTVFDMKGVNGLRPNCYVATAVDHEKLMERILEAICSYA